MATRHRGPRVFAGSASLSALLALAVLPACTATMPAVTMKGGDEHDGTPGAGVVALLWGTAREGTNSGHGGKTGVLPAGGARSGPTGARRLPRPGFPSP